ncbi:MAG: fumarylacetoacetate hydrolase family protein [Rhodobiaceae bacterium]|nr:fumarylacetoacetate hydrolase family protein [Rhodobiaceae bacterium]MCC0048455.1 fumarylacetoacetate hydrolase family protein [Rhodobiaceae bacterium]
MTSQPESGFVIPPPEQASLPVEGETGRFPVRRIYCVGRNYAAHAREMGHDPDREPPFFFLKPADAIVPSGSRVPYPPLTRDLQYEIELVAAIGKGGADIPAAQALDHVYGYCVGIDMTRRDLQGEAKKLGRPWDWGKGFDNSAPMGAIRKASDIGHPAEGRIWLAVDGEMKQDGNLNELIWPMPEIIAFASRSMRLEPGDLIMTGTPAGVGPVKAGQNITGGVDDVGEIKLAIF